jgi:hypothetical protein
VEGLGIELAPKSRIYRVTCQNVCVCSVANVEDLVTELARKSHIYRVTCQHVCINVYVTYSLLNVLVQIANKMGIKKCMCSIANVEDLGIELARQSRVYHVKVAYTA